MNEEYDECVFMCDGFLLHKTNQEKKKTRKEERKRQIQWIFIMGNKFAVFLFFFQFTVCNTNVNHQTNGLLRFLNSNFIHTLKSFLLTEVLIHIIFFFH